MRQKLYFCTESIQFFHISEHSVASASNSQPEIPLPSDQHILQHWIYLVDERRDSVRMSDDFYTSINWEIVDNLVAFWELYSSKELRYE